MRRSEEPSRDGNVPPAKEQIADFSRCRAPVDVPRGNTGGDDMTFKTLAAATLIAAFVTPAFAADEFYVVQDAKTKHCTIVDKKPVDTTTTVVSPSGTVNKTRMEAEAGMKTVKVCAFN